MVHGVSCPLNLQISTSRWFHTLYVQEPDGSTYGIEPGSTQGEASWTGGGTAWWNDYGYFSATAQYQAWMGPPQIVDGSTGEVWTGDLAGLLNWNCADTPGNVSAASSDNATVTISWTPGAAPVTGFTVQRRRAGSMEAWSAVAGAGPNDTTASDTGVLDAMVYSYRVIGMHATGNSLPSQEAGFAAAFTAASQWTMQNFGHPDPRPEDQSDPDADPDGDGFTNAEEQAAERDPRDPASKPPAALNGFYPNYLPGNVLPITLGVEGGNGHVTFNASEPGVGRVSGNGPDVQFYSSTGFDQTSFTFTVSQNAYTSKPGTITIQSIPPPAINVSAGQTIYFSPTEAYGFYDPTIGIVDGKLTLQYPGGNISGTITLTLPADFTITLNGMPAAGTLSLDAANPDSSSPLFHL